MSLNVAQQKAVNEPLDCQLQIIAGPGTGKTKTLTSRVVHMLHDLQVPPQNIVVMTFTNQAAKEMKRRITSALIEKGTEELAKATTSSLCIGTFHSVCFRFLMKHRSKMAYPQMKGIADEREKRKILWSILEDKDYKAFMDAQGYKDISSGTRSKLYLCEDDKNTKVEIKLFDLMTWISQEKCGETHTSQLAKIPNFFKHVLRFILKLYRRRLLMVRKLDFDDMLVDCKTLLETCPDAVENVRTVLVDEFQDTNKIQLDLTYLFCQKNNSLTVVGDPDQSIYAFRGAVPANFSLMRKKFSDCRSVFLEQNYRSVGPVLKLAIAVIKQDEYRIGGDERTLIPSLPLSDGLHELPTLTLLAKPEVERYRLEAHINNLIKTSKGSLKFSDFAILCRTNRQVNFYKEMKSIPMKTLNGRAFWEKPIISAIVSYLSVIFNIEDRVNIESSINIPKKGLGPVALQFCMEDSTTRDILGTTMVSKFEKIARSKGRPIHGVNLTTKQITLIGEYYKTIKKFQQQLENNGNNGKTISDIIRSLTDMILAPKEEQLKDHSDSNLEQEITKDEEAVQKLQEIVLNVGIPWYNDSDDGVIDDEELFTSVGALGYFLSTMAMGADTSQKSQGEAITIGTIHAAKGLEWPVVFLPDCHDVNSGQQDPEERRLLFVALTRAQWGLHMYYPSLDSLGFNLKVVKLSPFLSLVNPKLVHSNTVNAEDETDMAAHQSSKKHFYTVDEKHLIQGLKFLKRPIPNLGKNESMESRKRVQAAVATLPNSSFTSAASLLSEATLERSTERTKRRKMKDKNKGNTVKLGKGGLFATRSNTVKLD